MIEIDTLGGISVRRDGREIESISTHKKKLALLVYLAVEGKGTRDQLVGLFWPEREEERARHSLSQALYSLRRELGSDCLQLDAEKVVANQTLVRIDARGLERAVEEQDWRRAVELYSGHFMGGFALPGASGFEDWQSMTRARLMRLSRKAHRQLVDRYTAAGRLTEALSVASRWAELEPLEDEAQHALITLLGRTGQRASALTHYERYRGRLATELRVEPLDATTALVEELRTGSTPEFRPLGGSGAAVPAEAPKHMAVPRRERALEEGAGATGRPSFLRELRQRRMFHVGAAYLAVAWLGLQFASTLVEQAVFPQWVFHASLFILAIGLPVALLMAWAQEPPQRRGAAAGGVARPRPAWTRAIPGNPVLAVLAVLLAALAVTWALVGRRPSDGERRPSVFAGGVTVVVMPLAAPAAAGEEGPASRELHRLLINAVEYLPGIQAVDGSAYLGEARSWRTAGLPPLLGRSAEAGAEYLVAGELVPAGEATRLSIDLHSVAGRQPRVRRDGGPPEETIPDAVERIAFELALIIAGREGIGLGPYAAIAKATPSGRAFAELLHGQTRFWERDWGGAVRGYSRAVEADSNFALAYHRLSVARTWQHDDSLALSAVEAGLTRARTAAPRWRELLQAQRYYVLRFPDSAVAAFQGTVLDHPDNIDGWFGLGEAMIHLGGFAGYDLADARVALEKVTNLDNQFAPIYYHLFDLAMYAEDSASAKRYLARVDDVHRFSRQLAFELLWGSGYDRLASLDTTARYDISELVSIMARNFFKLELADTIASYLISPNRTPDDRLRGAQYRFVALAGQGRWEQALAAWRQGDSPSFDRWIVSAHFARNLLGDRADADLARLARPMLEEADDLVRRGAAPDFAKDVLDEGRQAFQALVHHATIAGDSTTVSFLLERLEARAPCAPWPSCSLIHSSTTRSGLPATTRDAMPEVMDAALRARLALLARDTANAILLLERSLSRVAPPVAMTFYPLIAMAPQRLLLAELYLATDRPAAAKRWLDSFSNLWLSVGDVLYNERVAELRRRL